MSNNTRRKFDRSFKAQAVKLVTEQGYKVTEAAVNLGIGVSTLGKWVRKYKEETDSYHAFPGKGRLNPRDYELNRLEKEVAKLKREREILKRR
jgi:transposase